MLEIKKNSIYKIKKSVALKNVLGETFFILDSETGKQYNLTEMEYEIVDSISKGISFGKIVTNIANGYDAPVEQIEIDLKEYFISLIDEGLISE